MTIPVLIHRFFPRHNGAWAYHPSLGPVYGALRDALQEVAQQGEPGPVGPVEVSGGRLVLYGLRTTDPDRPTDEFGRRLVVLRVAVLLADRPVDAEEMRRMLQGLRLPEKPGADEWLGLDGDGPGPADLSGVAPEIPPVVESPRKEKGRMPVKPVAVVGVCIAVVGVLVWAIFFAGRSPTSTPKISQTKGKGEEKPPPPTRIDQVAIQGRLNEITEWSNAPTSDWAGIVDKLKDGEKVYLPLIEQRPSDVADLLADQAKRWAKKPPSGGSTDQWVRDGQRTFASLEEMWKRAGADGHLLQPVRDEVEGARLRARYEAVRAAVNELAKELQGMASDRDDRRRLRIEALRSRIEYALHQLTESKPVAGVEAWRRKADAWFNAVTNSREWVFQVSTEPTGLNVTDVQLMYSLIDEPDQTIKLEPKRGEVNKFVLPDGKRVLLYISNLRFQASCSLSAQKSPRLETEPAPWKVGGPAKGLIKKIILNYQVSSVGFDCPELHAPKLPEYDKAVSTPIAPSPAPQTKTDLVPKNAKSTRRSSPQNH